MRAYLLWLSITVAACGSNDLKRVGESCTASSECGTGLLCDSTSHVCANMGSLDAPVAVDAALHDAHLTDAKPIDARPIDAPVLIDAPVDVPLD